MLPTVLSKGKEAFPATNAFPPTLTSDGKLDSAYAISSPLIVSNNGTNAPARISPFPPIFVNKGAEVF